LPEGLKFSFTGLKGHVPGRIAALAGISKGASMKEKSQRMSDLACFITLLVTVSGAILLTIFGYSSQ
jgi:hypothetical protein